MRDVQFTLVREGKSDDGLVVLIRTLLVRAGLSGVIGAARTYRGTTRDKLQQVLAEEVVPDLVFVHRDADGRDPSPRRNEIATAAAELACEGRVVGIVPVQETEAWLLTDEAAIRTVVGRPSGRSVLGLPPIRRIEDTANPKEILESACKVACEQSGARLKKTARAFPVYRSNLLERLDIDGPINNLASWRSFVDDLGSAVNSLPPDLLRSAEG